MLTESSFLCVSCGYSKKLSLEMAGRKVKCPKCKSLGDVMAGKKEETKNTNLNEVLCEATNGQDVVRLYHNKVLIDRSGFVSGKKNPNVPLNSPQLTIILLKSISSVELTLASDFKVGSIRFLYSGQDQRDRSFNPLTKLANTMASNLVLFQPKHDDEFAAMAWEVELAMFKRGFV